MGAFKPAPKATARQQSDIPKFVPGVTTTAEYVRSFLRAICPVGECHIDLRGLNTPAPYYGDPRLGQPAAPTVKKPARRKRRK